jgi:flagellar biosynthesis/type III secretory pathway protein FliH
VDTSNSAQREIDLLELENFALSGMEAQVEEILRQPGFAVLHDRIRVQAHAAGRAEALAEAEKQRREISEGPVRKLESLLAEMAKRRAEFAKRSEEELLQLSLAIAGRVLRVESGLDPGLLRERLSACLRQLEGESSIVIRVNPEQEQALAGLVERDGLPHFPDLPYRLVADRRVPPGSLVLEGDRTRLESICEQELARIEEHLLELFREQEQDDDA